MSRAICWLRRDLRLNDHRVLATACERHDEVVVVFVFDTNILDRLTERQNRRVTFIIRSLEELDRKLRAHGSRLVVLKGDPKIEIPTFAREVKAEAVYCGLDLDPYAIEREIAVEASLKKDGVRFERIPDQTIFYAGQVLSQLGTPFRVFTPYSRQWLAQFSSTKDAENCTVDTTKFIDSKYISSTSVELTHDEIGFRESPLWLAAGEDAGRAALADFESRIDRYGEVRDFPSIRGVSYLSVHLRFGTVSIREAVRLALSHDTPGAKKWLMELIWREFYQDILGNHPEVVRTTFDSKYRDMEWPGSDEHFRLWCEGKTGYPIVDAAMRCFNETGWMHNRLRMIVASFLTKDLLVDYRKGEAYFAAGLLDFDLASNNGGWQWAASVGCDAQPYFRIFNPYLQSRKFDAQGSFIREWVPELADLSDHEIHCPSPMDCALCDYPLPIVQHDEMRKRAVALFESVRAESAER